MAIELKKWEICKTWGEKIKEKVRKSKKKYQKNKKKRVQKLMTPKMATIKPKIELNFNPKPRLNFLSSPNDTNKAQETKT